MQIRCPHCGNVFESTGSTPFCPNCGQRVDPSADASGPAPQDPGMTSPGEEPNPWERRGEVGLLTGYWETWKSVMFSPDTFWERARPEGSLWDALAFSWIATAVSTLLSLPLQLIQGAGQLQQALDRMNDLPPGVRETLASVAGGGVMVGVALVGLLLFPVVFFIGAGIVHLSCMIFGKAQNGFTATARVVGYAAAPTLLSFIPCVNVLLVIYLIVLEVWGVAKLQRTTYGWAATVVIAPYVVLCCCGCSAVFASVMSAVEAAGGQ